MMVRLLVLAVVAIMGVVVIGERASSPVLADTARPAITPDKLIVRPKKAPGFTDDPRGWVQQKQRLFYDKMASAVHAIRTEHSLFAGWTLVLMSFIYGVLHAAGPGHGKAVVSAWLLANEQQLRRGFIIAGLAAFVQAMTAIVLVSGVLLILTQAGKTVRFLAASLESMSFALIALAGLYLIWQALRALPGLFAAKSDTEHSHHHHAHDHGHDHDNGPDCDCGHAHFPEARALDGNWSIKKAVMLAFAVGIRPCSGAILVLLLSASAGLYWAGIVSTFAMAVGTGITVSLVAALAVMSRKTALKWTGANTRFMPHLAFGLRFLAGLFITLTGLLLFAASLPANAQVTAGDDAPLRFGRVLHEGKVVHGFLSAGGVHELDRSFFDPEAKLTGRVLKLEDVTVLAPVEPKTVIGVALNYKSHGGSKGKEAKFFAKLATSIIGPGQDIIPPPGSSDLHYEGEMVIVIGAVAKNVKAKDAGEYIFGVTAGNDVTERGFGFSPFDVLRAKGADTLAPIGPWIVPGLSYDDLLLVTKVNGKVVQKSSTRKMIFNVGQIVEAVTRYITLQPGDVIFTGTPGTTRALKPSDVVEVVLEGVGTLSNTVKAP